MNAEVECGFVCWDGGNRNEDGSCQLEIAPGFLAGSGQNHSIVLRGGIKPGTPEWNQALNEVINQAEWLKL